MGDREAGVYLSTSPHSSLIGGWLPQGVNPPALLDCPVCRLSKLLGCKRSLLVESRNTGLVAESCELAQDLFPRAAGELQLGLGMWSGWGVYTDIHLLPASSQLFHTHECEQSKVYIQK